MNLTQPIIRIGVLKISFFLILFLNSYLSAKESPKYNLAICAIFKNEAPYLREWIEFHKLVGVKHFYLYNNQSSDNYYKVLKPYVKSGEVEIIEWDYATNLDGSNWPSIQSNAYNHAVQLAKNQAKWLAVLDVDEFLFPVEVDKLSTFLKDFEDVAAVCVNWQMYGTSEVKQILPGHLLIEDLIYKAPTHYAENVHVKSIIRPEFVVSNANPHCFVFLPGYFQVNSNKEQFSGPFSTVLIDKIRINHYWTRDEKFFYEVKLPRRQIWQDGSCMERANNINQEADTSIFKYVPKLKKSLNINS